MGTLKRLRPSPAMIVAIIALFVALGGAAYAGITLSNNSVRSNHIVNGQVKTPDLAVSAVNRARIRNNAVNSAKIADGQVTGADIGDGQVGSADIGDGQVGSADITDGNIGLGDLSAAATSDLNDATTLGGLSVAQIVAATGGKYIEARQAAGSVDIETLTPQNLVTLSLPEAGKYLINARMPVVCTYDGSDATGTTPDATQPLQPNIIAKAQLLVGGAVTDTVNQTCEAEGGQVIVLASIFTGRAVVEITRQIEVTGPTDVVLRGLSETSIALFFPVPAAARIQATASSSMIQAITVRT